jgi:hypothetical protein
MVTTSRKTLVFVVATLLTVILIYSSITKFDVIAKPPKHIDFLCRDATPTAPGAVKAEVCCQIINGNIAGCTKCQYDANDHDVGGCVNFYPERQMPGGNSTLPPPSLGTVLPSSGNNTGLISNGQTGPPNHLGTALPSSGNNTHTGALPASTVTKEHNTSSPKLLNSAENPANQQTSGHHRHKGEQNSGTSSIGNSQSGSSSNSGNTNSNPSSGESNNNNKK